jgi:hypothetical protein
MTVTPEPSAASWTNTPMYGLPFAAGDERSSVMRPCRPTPARISRSTVQITAVTTAARCLRRVGLTTAGGGRNGMGRAVPGRAGQSERGWPSDPGPGVDRRDGPTGCAGLTCTLPTATTNSG